MSYLWVKCPQDEERVAMLNYWSNPILSLLWDPGRPNHWPTTCMQTKQAEQNLRSQAEAQKQIETYEQKYHCRLTRSYLKYSLHTHTWVCTACNTVSATAPTLAELITKIVERRRESLTHATICDKVIRIYPTSGIKVHDPSLLDRLAKN